MGRIMVHMTDLAVPLIALSDAARVRVLEVRGGEPPGGAIEGDDDGANGVG